MPETEIVVLTMERSPGFVQRAIDAGAAGFVLKDRADAELPAAVRRASIHRKLSSARGRSWSISPYDAAWSATEGIAVGTQGFTGSRALTVVPRSFDWTSSVPSVK
jgi:DNA-binding NarL/FixJ family response regulator